MAKLRRVPHPPLLELLEIQCRSITIVRDKAGNILGKGIGDAKEIHSVEEFETFLENCRKEIARHLQEMG
jgi:hypothetical protein